MKRISLIVAACFFATFVAGPAYAQYGYYDRGPTEKWGYGGKWENENSSKGDIAKWVVLGIGALGLLWLGNKVLNMKKQEKVYQPSPPMYHPDKWPRGIEPPQQHQQIPPWQDQNRRIPASATYNVADPF